MKNWTLPITAFLLSFTLLSAQNTCDTTRAEAIMRYARQLFMDAQYREAPRAALAAIPLVTCDKARQSLIWQQIARWETEMEQFDSANVHFYNAFHAAASAAQQQQVLLDQAEMNIQARQLSLVSMYTDQAGHLPTAPDVAARLAAIAVSLRLALEVPFDNDPEIAEIPDVPGDITWRWRLAELSLESMLLKSDINKARQYGIGLTDGLLKDRKYDPNRYIHILLMLAEANMAGDRMGKVDDILQQLEQAFARATPVVQDRWKPDYQVMKLRYMLRNHQSAQFTLTFDQLLAGLDRQRLSHRMAEAAAYMQKCNYQLFLGNNREALISMRTCMALYQKIPDFGSKFLAVCQTSTGQCYLGLNELDLAANYLEKGATYLIQTLAPDGRLSPIRQMIGLYSERKDPNQMYRYIRLYEQTLSATTAVSDVQHFLLGRQWFNYHYDFGSLDSAIYYAEKALREYSDKVSPFYTKEMEVRLSHAYTHKKDYQKSYDLANSLTAYFEKRREKMGPHYATEHYAWMHAVAAYSGWFLYQQSPDTVLLQQVVRHCNQAESALVSLREALKTDRSLRWGTDEFLYSSLVAVRQYLYELTGDREHIEKAFQDSEVSQMVLFQEYLNTAKAVQFGDLTPDAAQEERDLLNRITTIQEAQDQVSLQKNVNQDSIQNELSNQLTALNRQYNQLIASFETRFPQYYRLKFDPAFLPLAQVQQQTLRPDETMLTFHHYYRSLMTLVIRRDTVAFVMTPFLPADEAEIEALERDINQYPERLQLPEADFSAYQSTMAGRMSRLYDLLIRPVAGMLTTNVLIQTCEKLAYLPFEALLTQPLTNNARLSAWPWMAQQHNISYIGTATVFDAIQKRKPLMEPKEPVLAFAPYFDGDTSQLAALDYTRRYKRDFYSPLPYSGEEAFAVAKLLKGQAFTGKEATLERFKSSAGQARILHTATHASGSTAIDEPSFIAFQAEKSNWEKSLLFPDQIYPLQLNADLVTLSACETGLGKYTQTEGLIGLVRAFQCAGARNVTASMWSVNDASTKAFMLLFYRQIKNGAAYSAALGNAKREFVKTNRQYAHPYYWAGFVLYGR